MKSLFKILNLHLVEYYMPYLNIFLTEIYVFTSKSFKDQTVYENHKYFLKSWD
jgi:hypothetical protein